MKNFSLNLLNYSYARNAVFANRMKWNMGRFNVKYITTFGLAFTMNVDLRVWLLGIGATYKCATLIVAHNGRINKKPLPIFNKTQFNNLLLLNKIPSSVAYDIILHR